MDNPYIVQLTPLIAHVGALGRNEITGGEGERGDEKRRGPGRTRKKNVKVSIPLPGNCSHVMGIFTT